MIITPQTIILVIYAKINNTLNNAIYYLVHINTELNKMDWFIMKNVTWYTDFYGNLSHCYHPHENVAVIIPRLCFNNISNSVAVQHLKQWCNNINKSQQIKFVYS